ncbi:AGE family epimerase/isomerase [Tamlana sp. I1]|uniref:AGE family epimerase/isomerase n=1 Tax=Tamlana sp. I1 TaxID=2762061 RepID=UPI00188F927A|nr:AGE family epimerase/isomerase [Tamlana sp. I1]
METYSLLKAELHSELKNILSYWMKNTLDEEFGGFVGKINHDNKVVENASKGIILNTRILWSFSAASNHLKTNAYQSICDRAFQYLITFFKDNTYKGVFWELDYQGRPINRRKQVYAQSFTIYALSEYYLFSKNETAKAWAIELFQQLEKHAKDPVNLGYFEAFNEDWTPIEDMRLSEKDMNASKTMNTHLHVLEAYTTLLKIYDNADLKKALKGLVNLFFDKFLNSDNHYELFFDNQWQLLSNSISYGHDIEAGWLIIEAAKALNDIDLIQKANAKMLNVADTFLKEALDVDGGVLNDKNRRTNHIDTDKHWWPQVEALIGLKYANHLNPDENYINASLAIWNYTKNHLIDHKHGEWFFRADKFGKIYTEEDKVSMWKAPYHTTRACILLNT